jgi:peroxiredoxin
VTGSLQDPDLYQTTIEQAVVSGEPTVVVFASPAFCTNAVCGPQIEVLQQLKAKYRGQANFIHVDFYDNPEEIQGDLDRARISPVVLEWRLPSIEWTFVIDRQGAITARFEAFATLDEVEEAFLEAL